jgi:hypothetical protein
MENNLIYICSPLRGHGEGKEAENMRRAQQYCRTIALLHPDLTPIAPHIYFTQFIDDADPDQRAWGMGKGIELLSLCSAIAVEGLGTVEPSAGMAAEIECAKAHGIRIIDLKELTGKQTRCQE